jgi:HlyD family secretion protein
VWRKFWLGPILLLVLASLVAGGYLYYAGHQPPPRYTTAAVERGVITATVNATGTVNAVTTVQVGTQVSGIVQELFADFNSNVKAGDVIAQIDPAPLATQVRQARASVASALAAVQVAQAMVDNTTAAVETAQANAASAEANVDEAEVIRRDALRVLDRNKELVRRSILSQSDLDTAQTAYDAAVSQLKAARARLHAAAAQRQSASAQERLGRAEHTAALARVDQAEAAQQAAELDLEHTMIRAPVNGIVVSRNVDVGQTVAASFQAPTLFLIAQDLTQMQVDTNVSEADIGQIQVGQTATFTVDAYPHLTFNGHVIQVRIAPIIVANVVTYNAVVQVANPELILKPGMTANVSFLVAEHKDILKVPNAALRFQPDGVGLGTPSPNGETPPGGSGGSGRAQTMPQRQQDDVLLEAREDGQAQVRPGRVWVVGVQGQPEARQLTLGLGNDTHTAVIAGDLASGQEVIIGSFVPTKSGTPCGPPGFRPGRSF